MKVKLISKKNFHNSINKWFHSKNWKNQLDRRSLNLKELKNRCNFLIGLGTFPQGDVFEVLPDSMGVVLDEVLE